MSDNAFRMILLLTAGVLLLACTEPADPVLTQHTAPPVDAAQAASPLLAPLKLNQLKDLPEDPEERDARLIREARQSAKRAQQLDPGGDFYRYTDRQGVLHMVDRWELVPDAYKSKVIRVQREVRQADDSPNALSTDYRPGRRSHYSSMESEANRARRQTRSVPKTQKSDKQRLRELTERRQREIEAREPQALPPEAIPVWVRYPGYSPYNHAGVRRQQP